MRRVALCCWSRTEASGCEHASGLEFVPASPVNVRPFARRLPRSDLDGVAIVVEAFNKTVDPSKTERLRHEVFIGHRLDPGVLLVADKPDAGARHVVLREPVPPLFPRSHVELD